MINMIRNKKIIIAIVAFVLGFLVGYYHIINF